MHYAEDPTVNRNKHGCILHGSYSLEGEADINKCQTQITKICSEQRALESGFRVLSSTAEELDLDWGHLNQALENE